MRSEIVIIGAGGHARVIADILRCRGERLLGYLDDKDASAFPDLPMLGKLADIGRFAEHRFIIGIGHNATRRAIALQHPELTYYTAIHPSAVIASDVRIGEGCAVMANAVINTGSVLLEHCIVNTAATLDHDNELAAYVHISPGAHLSGTVTVGEETWLGTGALVCNNVNLCGGCMIGAGAVVTRDITEPGTYVGVPARLLKRILP